MLLLGDCNHWLKEIKDNSIDLILTDPPYGIEFMGKDWDKALVQKETWKECYRVLKEGKLAFVMCSPRQDVLSRMIINLQDAGFRTNYTSIYWTYASGFPKAANVSKLLDKRNGKDYNQEFNQYLNSKRKEKGLSLKEINRQLGYGIKGGGMASYWMGESNIDFYGFPSVDDYSKLKPLLGLDNRYDELVAKEEAEREIIATKQKARSEGDNYAMPTMGAKTKYIDINITKPATEAAKKMEGAYVGFQPKPAVEVILVVSKGKTLTWLDDCRIPYQSEQDQQKSHDDAKGFGFRSTGKPVSLYEGGIKNVMPNHDPFNEKGRFPANLLVSDDCLNDGKITKSTGGNTVRSKENKTGNWGYKEFHMQGYGDVGSYSRYFSLDAWADKTFPFIITPKASRAERNKGLDSLEPVKVNDGRNTPIDNPFQRGETLRNNSHPTVKPLKLMSYLITMGSREGDLVLDPFCGSGTVCIAADQLHRKWIGIEKNEEYAAIIKKRLMVPLSQLKLSVWSGKKKDDSDGSQRIC